MRTVDQIRAGVSADSSYVTRKCRGYPGFDCDLSLEGDHPLRKRCLSCKPKNDSAKQRFFTGVKRERKARLVDLTAAQVEWQGMTEEQRTTRIVDNIRWGTSAGELAETYGITREKVREINCAHYQRRARIAA